jgi:hypothetical protein
LCRKCEIRFADFPQYADFSVPFGMLMSSFGGMPSQTVDVSCARQVLSRAGGVHRSASVRHL